MVEDLGPLLLFDSSLVGCVGADNPSHLTNGIPVHLPSLDSYFSCYYRNNTRNASILHPLAPHLVARLEATLEILKLPSSLNFGRK